MKKKSKKADPKKRRLQKYTVWLHNQTDRRDDEWISVWAYSPEGAKKSIYYDSYRFSLGHVYTTKEWRKRFGNLSRS